MKLTKNDRKDLVAALQAGKASVAQLSRTYGLSPSYVATVYRKDTGTLLRPVKRLSPSEKETIVAELLAKKATMSELATRYGVTPTAINYVYKKRVGRPFRPFPSWKLSPQDKATIIAELSARKATIEELAKRFAVPRGTISKIFRKQTGQGFGASHMPDKVKEAMIEEVRTNVSVTKQELAEKYGLSISTLERVIKRVTGKTFQSFRPRHAPRLSQPAQSTSIRLLRAQRRSDYRVWHTAEKQLYPVLGIDWYHSRVLIQRPQELVWLDMRLFVLMKQSGLRSRSVPDHPRGVPIYEGDIIQFPILLQGKDGGITEEIVTDVVLFERDTGCFGLAGMEDLLSLHHDECTIVGTVYAHPELVRKETYDAWWAVH